MHCQNKAKSQGSIHLLRGTKALNSTHAAETADTVPVESGEAKFSPLTAWSKWWVSCKNYPIYTKSTRYNHVQMHTPSTASHFTCHVNPGWMFGVIMWSCVWGFMGYIPIPLFDISSKNCKWLGICSDGPSRGSYFCFGEQLAMIHQSCVQGSLLLTNIPI